MRVEIFLYVTSPLTRHARVRWHELGGLDSAIRGSDAVQFRFFASDRASKDGKIVERLASEMRALHPDSVQLGLTARYDESDIRNAELLFVEVGTLEDVVDASSLTPAEPCKTCKLRLNQAPVGYGIRLVSRAVNDFDVFTSNLFWFVGGRLAESLRGFRGAALTEAITPQHVGHVFQFSGASSLGYPADGTIWGEPCPACSRRTGTLAGPFIGGLYQYPRGAWDGSDVLTAALYPHGIFVTPRVWRIISDGSWKSPAGVIVARPVLLVHAPPLW